MKKELLEILELSAFLKDNNLVSIVSEYLGNIKSFNYNQMNGSISLINDKDQRIHLKPFVKPSIIIKYSDFKEIEKISIDIIDGNPNISSISFEIRPNGIIKTEENRIYEYTKSSPDKKEIVNLSSVRSVFNGKQFEKILNNQEELSIKDFIKINYYINGFNIKPIIQTKFNAFTKYLIELKNNVRLISPITCSNHVFLNGKNISRTFDLVEGKNSIMRIYDLYNGIINEKNHYDIMSIELGLLDEDALDLKGNRGITLKEDELVGKPYIKK